MESKVIDGDFEAPRDGIHATNAVKHDVDRRYEDLPHAIQGEKVAQSVEVFPFESLGVNDALLMVPQVV